MARGSCRGIVKDPVLKVLSAIWIGRGNSGRDPHPVMAMRTGRLLFTIAACTRLPGGGLWAGAPAGRIA